MTALQVPEKDRRRWDLVALVIEPLPRVGPFRLEEGRRAFETARGAARRALGAEIWGGEVRVAGGSL